jgi:hypothetical protein
MGKLTSTGSCRFARFETTHAGQSIWAKLYLLFQTWNEELPHGGPNPLRERKNNSAMHFV